MKKILFFILISVSFYCCSSDFETVETKDEKGKVKAVYTVRKADGKKHGAYQLFYDGKLTEEGTFQNEMQTGERKIYYPNGTIQVLEIYNEKGVFQEKKTYYNDGTLQSEGKYDEQGAMTGEWTYYYQNGKKKEIVNFKNNLESGAFKEFHDNGKLKTEGIYNIMIIGLEELAVEHGELKEYDKNGDLALIKQCDKGRCVVVWSKNGEQ